MTVVAWDGAVLAADTMITDGNAEFNIKTKLTRLPDGGLMGFAGVAGAIPEFVAWFKSGRDVSKFPDHLRGDDSGVDVLYIDKNGKLHQFNKSPYCFEISDKFFAIGGGAQCARVAMHCGKSAKDAVKISSIYTSGCGGKITSLSFIKKVK